MNTIDITDPRVQKALEAIDSGEITGLVNLINKYPELVIERLHNHEESYFKDPYCFGLLPVIVHKEYLRSFK
jgi:hypothetical protein